VSLNIVQAVMFVQPCNLLVQTKQSIDNTAVKNSGFKILRHYENYYKTSVKVQLFTHLVTASYTEF